MILYLLLVLIIIQVSYLIYRTGPVRITAPVKNPVYVDTSALMDGRIVTAAQTGFIPYDIVVPKSVIAELQYLADQADNEKRSRARRGIDAVAEMQQMPHVRVTILDDGPTDEGGVDERLVSLAKKHNGSICTIDFNLNKVASVQGITILNINELAGSIRMAFLPGETISLALSQKGQGSSQAVGYLSDGTMVVVDKASSMIGQTVEIEFIRSLQTAAGRMMFAKLKKQVGTNKEKESTEAPRLPAQKKSASQSPKGRAPKQPNEPVAPDTSAMKPKRQPRRRQTKEDSLIELVNNQ